MEFSLVLPCLNKSATLARSIGQIREGAEQAGNSSYEVIVSDNRSEDGSQGIAWNEGARFMDVPQRGYGAAWHAGISAAKGKCETMGGFVCQL